MSSKLKLGIPLLAIIASGAVFLVARHGGADSQALSLTFQRYSDLDPYVYEDVGFFWLTNASDKTFLLYMTGGSNTMVLDTVLDMLVVANKRKPKMSFMVNCAFSDQTAQGWSNWVQEPLPSRGRNALLQLAPPSGMVIRAPLPTNGQKRKVAAICEAPVPAWRVWLLTNGTAQPLVRMLPRWARHKFYEYKPTIIEVWCDQQLSHPGEGVGR